MAVDSQVPQGRRGNDVLSIPYPTGEGLDTIIARDIFPKATCMSTVSIVCGIEAEVVSLDNPDWSWKAVQGVLPRRGAVGEDFPSQCLNIAVNRPRLGEGLALRVYPG